MFISLINLQTRMPNSVNTDHIVSIWSAEDPTGAWEVTRCRDQYLKNYFYNKLALNN